LFTRDFIEGFYSKHIDVTKGNASGEELRVPCPYHDDENPSFSVNLCTGLYKCFHPKCKLYSGGNIYHFYSHVSEVPLSEAKTIIDSQYQEVAPKETKPAESKTKFPYTQDHIVARTAELMNNQDALKFLMDIGWTIETINRFEIGYEGALGRYWIPIKEGGNFLNVRKYSTRGDPKFTSINGHGEARIWPADNLVHKDIVLMEGEKDCILANQWGLNAVTVTGGAGTFKSHWKEYFIDKNVVICYDIDEAGKEGAIKACTNISAVSKNVKIVELPITEPKNGDFSDYAKAGHTPQDFLELIDKTKTAKKAPEGPVAIDDEVQEVGLDQIDAKKMFYKRAKMNVRVIGKDFSPFIIPKSITVTCNKDNGKYCYNCAVGDTGGKSVKEINETTTEVLELVECSNRDRRIIIKEIFSIPTCRKFNVLETEHQSIIKTQVIPSVDDIQFDNETYNQKYVERELYYLGEVLEANMDYEIEALAMPSSRDQTLVHLGYKVKPADSSIEEFKLNDKMKAELKIFQCQSTTN